MAKPTLIINAKEFQNVVNELESKNTFKNIGELWKAIEETSWAKSLKPRPLTFSVAMIRAKELGITTKTLPGKRGKEKGSTLTEEHKAALKEGRKNKKKISTTHKKTFDAMRKTMPNRIPLIIRAEQGSKNAFIKLNCLDCSDNQPSEVKYCQCYDCPMFPIRPYQKSKNSELHELTEKFKQEGRDFEIEQETQGIKNI
jgi:hypothetical protein